jgi:hypothetical protein
VSRLPALQDGNQTAATAPTASAGATDSADPTASATRPAAASKKPTQAIVVPTTSVPTTESATTRGTGGGGQTSTGSATNGAATNGAATTTPSTTKPSKAAATVKPSATPSSSVTAAEPDLKKEELGATLTAVTDADGSDAPFTTLSLHVQGKIYGSLDDVDITYRTAGARSTIHRDNKVTGACVPQTGQLHEIDEMVTFRYRFRLAAAYVPSVTIRTWDHNCTSGVARREWKVLPTVDISTGSALSNGPEPIVINMSGTPQGSVIALSVASSDPDGYIRTATVDWGAGGSLEVLGGDSNPCDESGGRYWPDSWTRHNVKSPPLAAGTYTVTATVTSTGCDGKDSQSATKQVTVVVP